ncbi:MAG: hypothetical protein JO041_07510 [Acidobacteria bacterium]|nr:hypothetical protein [Acidobacteriota bacterium]
MDQLLAHDRSRVLPAVAAEARAHGNEMAGVSPAGRLGSVQVPVLLLHGAADNVIPPSETLWLASELPPAARRAVLISPAISHVEIKGPGFMDRLRLVNWMQVLLHTADSSPHGRSVFS